MNVSGLNHTGNEKTVIDKDARQRECRYFTYDGPKALANI